MVYSCTKQCLATLLLVGSSASTLINFIFIYVLSNFPSFIRQVKSGGAEPDVVVRLSTFYQLNVRHLCMRLDVDFRLIVPPRSSYEYYFVSRTLYRYSFFLWTVYAAVHMPLFVIREFGACSIQLILTI